ncbi:MAG: nickel pincer cofactor biosynthesis protein LarC [Leptolyngbya sp. SIO4C1]|nr:nickel pincer cofactor biosynthesis protein LarC [Leptolyngbya sp. SIO4C1]
MSKIAYLDCPSGIAGDMCLGALLDAGLALSELETQLKQLGIESDYALEVSPVQRQGQAATRVEVRLHNTLQPARHLPEIEHIILNAALPPRVTDWSLAIFRRLAAAEAAVHGIAPEQVHFHEVGATDAIVDVVGTCIGLDALAVEQIYCSALPTGGGTVYAAHGQLPVPAPAVLKLMTMAQVPIYSNGIEKELVTPTGAAIATTLAQRFGPPPAMQLQAVGLGAGGRDLPLPNILRLWLGSAALASAEPHYHAVSTQVSPAADSTVGTPEPIVELQTQLDDMSPQAVGYVFEQLFAAGAVDVFTQAVGMKKNRPGVLLTVICPKAAVNACQTVLFAETTTLGIRQTQQMRHILQREQLEVVTPYGSARVKLARHQGQLLNLQPEYEDCARLARSHSLPWKQIHQVVIAQALAQLTTQAPASNLDRPAPLAALGSQSPQPRSSSLD